MKKLVKIGGIVTGALLFGVLSFGETEAQADTSSTVNVYRLYNPNTGEHFYTTGTYERSQLIAVGWQYEGVGWTTSNSGQPVYRLYNPNAKGGDHYYTMSSYEKESLVKKGWRYDGTFWKSSGTVPVQVAYNPNAASGAHNYTTNTNEQNNLLKSGWKYGQTAWYATGYGRGIQQSATQLTSGNLPCPVITSANGKNYLYGALNTNESILASSGLDNFTKVDQPAFTSKAPFMTNLKGNDEFSTTYIAKIDGRYVMYYTANDQIPKVKPVIGVATSDNIEGPYTSKNTPLVDAANTSYGYIDPAVITINGTSYLTYTLNAPNEILVQKLSADGLSTVGNPYTVFGGADVKKAPNGQKIARIERSVITQAPDGTFVLFYSAWAGTEYYTGYATSSSLTGKYTDGAPVLTSQNMATDQAGETSVFSSGGKNYFIFNAWIGPHKGFTILPGGVGRPAFQVGFSWVNGHIPVPNFN